MSISWSLCQQNIGSPKFTESEIVQLIKIISIIKAQGYSEIEKAIAKMVMLNLKQNNDVEMINKFCINLKI